MYSDGPGSGTQTMRELVKLSLALEFNGNIELEAFDSSHIFHLFMGMVPDETVLDSNGFSDVAAQNQLSKLKACSDVNDIPDPNTVLFITLYLAEIYNKSNDEITKQMIFDNKEFLLSPEAGKISYIQDTFAPKLLDILESNTENKRPDTSSLGNVLMVLSDEGKTRWKRAIELSEPFEPFRDFSHLRSHMSPEQIQRLDQIVQNKLAKAAAEMKKDADVLATVSTLSIFANQAEGNQPAKTDSKQTNTTLAQKINTPKEVNTNKLIITKSKDLDIFDNVITLCSLM
jgi:hypothetical protein